MLGHNFYNETTKRYVAVVGTLFNDIKITRRDNSNTAIQSFTVPVAYGPAQKFLAMIEQDPLKASPAITLPRISFEIMTMIYDPERKVNNLVVDQNPQTTDDDSFKYRFAPAPYNIDFQVVVMAKYAQDGAKIVEQVIPFFNPEWTPTVKVLDDPAYYVDVPVILNAVSVDDVYEGNFEERRAIMWVFDLTLKGYYFGPQYEKKIIKFANTNLYTSLTANTVAERVKVQPGLTANGEPTTYIANTVPYADINSDDDWDYIVQIEDD